MEIVIGIVSGIVITVFSRIMRFDRDASFYPVVLIVIAFYYVLFSVIDGNSEVIIYELLIALAFTLMAIMAVKISIYLVAAGMILHGIYDAIHHYILINEGVPSWWPGFCAAVDIVLGILVLYFSAVHSRNKHRIIQDKIT